MNKENLKIVFFGTPEFAVASLNNLVEGGFNVSAVVTMPDKPAGRGNHIIQSDVKKYAVEKGLRVLQPEKLKAEEFVNELREINADLFIVIAFRMLPEVVWQMPRLGTFNLHASLLPKYRGAAPLNWAVINGDTETGVTTFFLKHEIDTGDVIQRRSIPIAETDNVGIIHDKLMEIGADMVVETVNDIINGTFKTIPQDELITGKPTPAPKIFKDTCHIDWSKDCKTVYNLIRGLSPYPAAWNNVTKNGKDIQIKIFESVKTEMASNDAEFGSIKVEDGKIFVACSDFYLQILSLQQAGKKRMNYQEFLRGFDLNGYILK